MLKGYYKFVSRIQPSLLSSANRNMEKTYMFLVFLRKKKERKLRKSYQMNMNHYLYPKDYDPSIGTFSVNRHIFIQ